MRLPSLFCAKHYFYRKECFSGVKEITDKKALLMAAECGQRAGSDPTVANVIIIAAGCMQHALFERGNKLEDVIYCEF